jgi:hypothetical protein
MTCDYCGAEMVYHRTSRDCVKCGYSVVLAGGERVVGFSVRCGDIHIVQATDHSALGYFDPSTNMTYTMNDAVIASGDARFSLLIGRA